MMHNSLLKSGLAATAAAGLCLGAASADVSHFVPGFDVAQARQRLGRPADPTICPATPAPISDMGGIVSRYDPKDQSQSHIDPARDAASKAQEAGLTAFAKQIDRESDRALLARPVDHTLDACIMGQLATWARADALDRNVDANDRVGRDQAIMEQAWYGAAFASSVAKIGGFEAAPGPDAEVVQAWFQKLANSVMTAYTGTPATLRAANNHRYWAGYAVAVIGTLLQDRSMLAFGRDVLSQGLDAVAADGSLPAEMARGSKALVYQYFATLPLAALVTLADRNGMPLDADEDAAIERLVAFDLASATEPGIVETIARTKQEPAVTASALGWIDMLLPYMIRRKASLAAAMDATASRPGLRPAWFIFLGGDVTAAYNPGARVTPTR